MDKTNESAGKGERQKKLNIDSGNQTRALKANAWDTPWDTPGVIWLERLDQTKPSRTLPTNDLTRDHNGLDASTSSPVSNGFNS